jgi:hypothetical protein
MMTQQLGFSILSAPLAAIDRRALSEAWYSALHLAHERGPSAQFPAVASAHSAGPQVFAQREHVSRPVVPRAAEVASRTKRPDQPTRIAAQSDRRAPRSVLARRIERTFLDPSRRVQRATFSVEGSNARVHVTLQDGPGGLRLVAVCPPVVRSGVVRALEEARFALAARGIALRVDVKGERA